MPQSTDITIPVVGIDPSLNNWGMVKGEIKVSPFSFLPTSIVIHEGIVSSAKKSSKPVPRNQRVNKNVQDLIRANQIISDSFAFIDNSPKLVFAELPIGSQSSRASAGYGICIGIAGCIDVTYPLTVVTPHEVKMATAGVRDASKEEIIQWAINTHPEYKMPSKTVKGVSSPILSQAEHIADAIGAIHAGISKIDFKSLLDSLVRFK